MTPASTRARRQAGYLALALLAYGPALLTARGRVSADTKSYLTLDPDRLLERAPSMWDPNIGLGTVTHQNIGYLFPLGPYYWLAEHAGVPDWLAQRIWLGSLVFAAALGVLYLARALGRRGPGVVVAALAYSCSPYVLHYSARISVILLPWAALGFLIGFVARALRDGGWRYPALFAITVQVVGGVNATALVFAGIAPVLWVAWAWLGTREVTARQMFAATGRVALLTLAASAWWLAGLGVQGGYGINVLRYTETVEVVAFTSTPNEILRGLGYWFFYGRDRLGAWVDAANDFMTNPALILATYGLAALSVLAAVSVRWRHRGYFVLLLLVGAVVATGAHPYDSPTPLGAVFKSFATSSTAGLALRSTARAVPLVTLSLAMFLGAGVDAAVVWLRGMRRPRLAIGVPIVVGGLVLGAFPALWNGTYATGALLRDEDVPGYWQDALARLDEGAPADRVLELPGSDFASYRWGGTVDPITPGLVDRPYVARELIPWGSAASADLLNALDRRIQEGVADGRGLADLLRRLGVGTVVVRNDLEWERYNLARPGEVAAVLDGAAGLDRVAAFGELSRASAAPPLGAGRAIDERTLASNAMSGGREPPGAVVVYDVAGSSPIVRVARDDVVLAGDGEGVVSAGEARLLPNGDVVRYAASMSDEQLRTALGHHRSVLLVVTDTNRRRARRWSTVRDNVGETETAGQVALTDDPSDARLPVFPDAGDDSFTVVEYADNGGPRIAMIRATASGNPITHTPEDRPARAFDGDPRTAWKAGAVARAVGERIELTLAAPITASEVRLTQVRVGPRNRFITHARLRFDGGPPLDVELGDASRGDGQLVDFSARTFTTLSIEVLATNMGDGPLYGGQSAVGFAEIELRDVHGTPVHAHEMLRVPTDLTSVAAALGGDWQLAYVFERARVEPVPPRYDEELSLDRRFSVPAAGPFELEGDGRPNPNAYDPVAVNGAYGVTVLDRYDAPAASGVLPGCLRCGAAFAFDGDARDAWQPPIGEVEGSWIELRTAAPVVHDRLRLAVVADGRHSLPARVRVEVDNHAFDLAVPRVDEHAEPMATEEVELTFPPMRGRRLRIVITAVEARYGTSYYDPNLRVLPVGIASTGITAVEFDTEARTPLDLGCRDDLIALDGTPLPVRLRAPAGSERRFAVTTCDGAPLRLAAGEHDLTTARGVDTAIDIDRLVLRSASWLGGPGLHEEPAVPATILHAGRTELRVQVDVGTIGWLVFGQSYNSGWRARIAGGPSLGEPTLVDGYANGWYLDPEVQPGNEGEQFEVVIEWTPQRRVRRALAVSALAVLACLAIAVTSRRRPSDAASGGDAVLVARLRGPLRPQSLGGRVVFAVAAGALVSVVVAPRAGVVAGALVFAALTWRAAAIALAVLPAACLGGAGVYIAYVQWKYHHPPVFEWPTLFPRARTLGWIAATVPALVWLVDARRDVAPRDVAPRDVAPRDVAPRDVAPRDVAHRDVGSVPPAEEAR